MSSAPIRTRLFGHLKVIFLALWPPFRSSAAATELHSTSSLFSPGNVTVLSVSYTSGETLPLTSGDKVMIIILCAIVLLCLIGTALDLLPLKLCSGRGGRLLLAFSLYTNSKKLLSMDSPSDNLRCLNGIRVLSIAWTVFLHTWYSYWPVQLVTSFSDLIYMPVVNCFVFIDTFFVLSGVLVAYSLLQVLDRTKGKLHYLGFVLHRCMRLVPTYAFLIAVLGTVVKHIGAGPRWGAVIAHSQKCSEEWWMNLLFVNNLFSFLDRCYMETWYLANDMQFYLLSPLVLVPLWRRQTLGYGLLAALIALPVIITAGLLSTFNLTPIPTPAYPAATFERSLSLIYNKPWTRCGPYWIGLGVGYLLHLRRRSKGLEMTKISPIWVAVGWVTSLMTALLVVFAPAPYWNPANAELTLGTWHSIFYGAVHRILWALVIAWVIYACETYYGGFVAKVLTWKGFIPMGRLAFGVYMIHIRLIDLFRFSQGVEPATPSGSHIVLSYIVCLVGSGILAFVLAVAVEMPIARLGKILFMETVAAQKKNKKSA